MLYKRNVTDKHKRDKITIKTKDSGKEIQLVYNLAELPTNLDCLTPCIAELDRIRDDFENRNVCDDIVTGKNTEARTFFSCYFRERKIKDFFIARNPIDVAVLTCYLRGNFYYFIQDEIQNYIKDQILYEDCISKGELLKLFTKVI